MKKSYASPTKGKTPSHGQMPPSESCPVRQRKQLAMPTKQELTLPKVLGK